MISISDITSGLTNRGNLIKVALMAGGAYVLWKFIGKKVFA